MLGDRLEHSISVYYGRRQTSIKMIKHDILKIWQNLQIRERIKMKILNTTFYGKHFILTPFKRTEICFSIHCLICATDHTWKSPTRWSLNYFEEYIIRTIWIHMAHYIVKKILSYLYIHYFFCIFISDYCHLGLFGSERSDS